MAKATEKATLEVGGQVDFSKIDKGIAKLDAKLNQMSKSQRGLNTEAGKSERTLENFARGAQAAVAALAASQVAKFTVELVNLGAAAEQAQMSLDLLSEGQADEYMLAIKEASLDTISSMDAMTISARSLRFGIVSNADEMARLTEIAMVMGQTMGISTTQALNDMSTGIARQSKLILDNIGILVDHEKIQDDIARRMSENAYLTRDQAKQQAWLNAVLEQGDILLAKTGGVMENTATEVQKLTTEWQDLKVKMGEGAAEVFGPAIHGANELIDGLHALADAKKTVKEEVAATSDTFEEYVRTLHKAGIVNYAYIQALEAGTDAGVAETQMLVELQREFGNLRAAAMAGYYAMPIDPLEQVSGATQEVTEAVEDEEEALKKAEQAYKQYIQALQDSFNEQKRIANITEDLVGQFDTLGKTFYSIVPTNNEAALAAERYGENLADLQAEAAQLQQDIQFLGDGEGALAEKLAQTNAAIAQQQAAMDAASMSAGDLKNVYTVTQLTQEQLNLVGESFLDLLSATDNELLMTGDSYDAYRVKMGLAVEEQIRLEHASRTLMDALEQGQITVEQAGDAYLAVMTGQVASAEEAIASQQEYNRQMMEMHGLSPADLGIAETFDEAVEPTATVAEQFGAMADSVQQLSDYAPAAFETLAELAPGTAEALQPFYHKLVASSERIKGMTTDAPAWSEAINAAGAALGAGESGFSLFASKLSGVYSDWFYLQNNRRLELEALITITTIGGVPGAAGGANFVTDHPMLLPVGEIGRERVTVEPLYNSAGIPRFNPSMGIGMAAGGSLTAGYGGGVNIGAINIYASGMGGNTRQWADTVARDLADALEREYSNRGQYIPEMRITA